MYWKKPGVEGFSKLTHAPDAQSSLASRFKGQDWMNKRLFRILAQLAENV